MFGVTTYNICRHQKFITIRILHLLGAATSSSTFWCAHNVAVGAVSDGSGSLLARSVRKSRRVGLVLSPSSPAPAGHSQTVVDTGTSPTAGSTGFLQKERSGSSCGDGFGAAHCCENCIGGAGSMPTSSAAVASSGNGPASSPSSPEARETAAAIEKKEPPAGDWGKPNWWYKSFHMCTAADGDDSGGKCKPDAGFDHCDMDDHFPDACKTGKKTCAEMGEKTMKENSNALGGFGFMCPHLMLGTSELLQAAKDDGKDPATHAYGVATLDQLKCGQCAEVYNKEPQLKYAPKLTIQNFNSGAGTLDVYMAGGGYGANNGCSDNPKSDAKHSTAFMYAEHVATERMRKHLASRPDAKDISDDFEKLDLNKAITSGGGIRGGRSYAECMKKCTKTPPVNCRTECQLPHAGCNGVGEFCITDRDSCEIAFKGKSEYVTKKAIESCKWCFDHDMHWNRRLEYKVVPCPAGLVALTGLRPLDLAQGKEAGFPVDIGFRTSKMPFTTTMEDCSAPTCSRAANCKDHGKWQPGYDAMYTCNILGEKILEGEKNIPKNPCAEGAKGISSAGNLEG